MNIKIDGTLADAGGNVELRLGNQTYTMAKSSTGVYTVSVPAGAYDIYVGGTDTGVNITVSNGGGSAEVDISSPTLTAKTPSAGSTGVAVNTPLTMTFSSNVVAVSGKNITVKKTSDDSVAQTISATDSRRRNQ